MSKRKLIPFIFSSDIAYLVELGQGYARFYYNDDEITAIETPYGIQDNFRLHYVQLGDVMRIVNPSHKPRRLLRVTATEFELEETQFSGGPFEVRHDLIDPDSASVISLSCSVTQPSQEGILTATQDFFSPGHVGTLFKLTHSRLVTEVVSSGQTQSAELHARGTISFITRGTWNGVVVVERNENYGEWEAFRTYRSSSGAARNASFSYVEKEPNVRYRISPQSGMSTGFRAELTVNESTHSGIVRVTGYIDPKQVNVVVIERLERTIATRKWFEGSWSDVRGWPSAIAFFEDRCVYAGAAVDGEPVAYTYPMLINSPI